MEHVLGIEPAREGDRLLDVGGGRGEQAELWAGSGYAVTVLEPDQKLLEGFAPDARQHGVSLVRGDGCRMPAADKTFDAAVLTEVFEHIDDPSLVLREIARVLKPGAWLWMTVPTGYTEAIYEFLHPRYASNAGHVRRYRKCDIVALIQSAGLDVRTVQPHNLDPALSWVVHAALRSDADFTGRVANHLWVDRVLWPVLGAWRHLPILRSSYRFLERRVGKSWSFVCYKSA